MTIASILGILGFALALGLAVLEYSRYRKRLLIRVRNVEVLYSRGDTQAVAMRVCFVNPSSRGMTLWDLAVDRKRTQNVVPVKGQVSVTQQQSVYVLSSNPAVVLNVPTDQCLQFPLDILPAQSQSGWYIVEIHPVPENLRVSLSLVVFSADERIIARLTQEIDLT